MLYNYFKVAIRDFRRHATYSFINISGLAVGMAACLLIASYIHHELSYDRFNEHADRIYRVVQEQSFGAVQEIAVTPAPVAPALLETFPEIEYAVRFYASTNTLQREGIQGVTTKVAYTDSTVFNVFSLPLIQGDLSKALVAPNTIVLTETTAKNFFGQENALGNSLTFNDEEFVVTGVMADVPSNAHFHFEALASFSTLEKESWTNSWARNSFWTYILLRPETSAVNLEAKFPAFIGAHIERSDAQEVFKYFLQPLRDIHLHSKLISEFGVNNDISVIYIFSGIAFFILIIAAINYINLSTARSSLRMREVGIRKVMGANRKQLVYQFLGEALIFTFLALGSALLLMWISLPVFSEIMGVAILFHVPAIFSMAGLFILIGLASGAYPAFHLSGFRPVSVLKGKLPAFGGAVPFRKALVVVQFTISIALIVSVSAAYFQLQYIQNKDLGYNKEYLISVDVQGATDKIELLKSAFSQHPSVTHVAAAYKTIGDGNNTTTFRREGTGEDNMKTLAYLEVDPEFVSTMGMTILAGRNFSSERPTDIYGNADETYRIILNESGIRAFGWATPEEAVGQRITQGGKPTEIIGVVKDFHFATFHQSIDPISLWWDPPSLQTIVVRLKPEALSTSLADLQTSWSSVLPDLPFTYVFVDEHLNGLYRGDQRIGKLFAVFAILALVIACLGLFGLTSFTTQQRRKEIGVRKVLGASVQSIVTLLSKDVIQLIGIAFVFSAPIAYIVINNWLNTFAYRIHLSIWVFLVAGMVALSIALLTVGYQSVRAAQADPVQSLLHI